MDSGGNVTQLYDPQNNSYLRYYVSSYCSFSTFLNVITYKNVLLTEILYFSIHLLFYSQSKSIFRSNILEIKIKTSTWELISHLCLLPVGWPSRSPSQGTAAPGCIVDCVLTAETVLTDCFCCLKPKDEATEMTFQRKKPNKRVSELLDAVGLRLLVNIEALRATSFPALFQFPLTLLPVFTTSRIPQCIPFF